MPTFRDTIMIKDRSTDRAVKVTIEAPEGVSVLNVQELAETAWRPDGEVNHSGRRHCEGPSL